MAATSWPLLSLVVPSRAVGTGVGLTTSMQMLTLTLVGPLVGYIIQHASFLFALDTFGAMSVGACMCCVLLLSQDRLKGGLLNRSGKKIRAGEAEPVFPEAEYAAISANDGYEAEFDPSKPLLGPTN